jgi:uncharacterized protein YigA (DUF484 family)
VAENKTISARLHRLHEFLAFCYSLTKYPYKIPKSKIRKLKDYKLFLIAGTDDELIGHIFREQIKFLEEFMQYVAEKNNGNESAAIETLKKSMERQEKCTQLMKEVQDKWHST